MHTETISDPLWELLYRLNFIPDMKSFYLGGGTALALHLGHRKSYDLDFFATGQLDFLFIQEKLREKKINIQIVNCTSRHAELILHAIKVDFIREPIARRYPLWEIKPNMGNIKIADPIDIGRMKLISVGSRGSKKDFVDLFCLTRRTISLESLIMISIEEDHGVKYNKLLFLKGLVDFEEADKEPDPVMIWDIGWAEVKNALTVEVKKIAQKIAGSG